MESRFEIVSHELRQFARDTCHTREEIDTPKQISQLARKTLALHIKALPWTLVYHHANCGDDLAVRSFRMTGIQPVANYAANHELDPHFVAALIQDATYETPPMFEQFQANVLPRPKGEEAWRNAERPDAWEDVAAYIVALHGIDSNSFRDAWKAALSTKSERQIEAAYNRLKNYSLVPPGKHGEEDAIAGASEIGHFIKSMEFPTFKHNVGVLVSLNDHVYPNKRDDEAYGTSGDDEPGYSSEEHREDYEDGLPMMLPNWFVVTAKEEPKQTWDDNAETTMRNNALLAEAKERAGLRRQFSSARVAGQILLGPACEDEAWCSPLWGNSQRENATATISDEKDWETISSIFDYFPALAEAARKAAEEARKLIGAHYEGQCDEPTALKLLLAVHSGEGALNAMGLKSAGARKAAGLVKKLSAQATADICTAILSL
jgi:Phosphotransferase enzyme family